MIPKRKSSIHVRKTVTYTEGGNAKIVTPDLVPPSTPMKKSVKWASDSTSSKKEMPSSKGGKGLWKNVPMAIRFAKSNIETRLGCGQRDERVDERLKEMCHRAFITGEMENRAYTLEEIGQFTGVSRERIRQIQEEAMTKMRSLIKQKFGWEMSLEDLLGKDSRAEPCYTRVNTSSHDQG